jgi:predicted Rossmann-fold nucleotide-binding protein
MLPTMLQRLYAASDLLDGFNPFDDLGFTLTRDFEVFRQFVSDGGPVPSTLETRLVQARHDATIADALKRFLRDVGRPLVGFMGGHAAKRDSPAFSDIAKLAWSIAQDGYLVVTGGGPGVMEAAHVGVAFSRNGMDELERALAKLADTPNYGDLDDLFESDGSLKKSKRKDVMAARDWLAAALDVRSAAPSTLPLSLAIPTWLYGAEPTMPFATHYAKYYQNSLREEALVNNSRAGIIYGQGGGGTLREIFQDVERNYYAKDAENFTPMIFFDKRGYWLRAATYEGGKVTSYGVKLDDTVPGILKFGICARLSPDEATLPQFLDKIAFTDDVSAIKNILAKHSGVAKQNMSYALAGESFRIPTLRMNRA